MAGDLYFGKLLEAPSCSSFQLYSFFPPFCTVLEDAPLDQAVGGGGVCLW